MRALCQGFPFNIPRCLTITDTFREESRFAFTGWVEFLDGRLCCVGLRPSFPPSTRRRFPCGPRPGWIDVVVDRVRSLVCVPNYVVVGMKVDLL